MNIITRITRIWQAPEENDLLEASIGDTDAEVSNLKDRVEVLEDSLPDDLDNNNNLDELRRDLDEVREDLEDYPDVDQLVTADDVPSNDDFESLGERVDALKERVDNIDGLLVTTVNRQALKIAALQTRIDLLSRIVIKEGRTS
jgi:predicted nuclease with TOPRIM domain